MFGRPSSHQDAVTTTLAGVIMLLESREKRANAAWTVYDRGVRAAELGHGPIRSAEEIREARLALQCASARWTEAQEALATVRELAARLTP